MVFLKTSKGREMFQHPEVIVSLVRFHSLIVLFFKLRSLKLILILYPRSLIVYVLLGFVIGRLLPQLILFLDTAIK